MPPWSWAHLVESVRALSLVVLASLLLGLAAYIWQARRSSKINRRFAMLTLSIAAWVLGIGGVESGVLTEMWGRVTFAAACVMPVAFLAFSRVFPATSRWPTTRVLRVTFVVGTVLAVLSLATRLIAYDISQTETGIRRTSGVLFPLFTAHFLICSIAALSVFIGKWRSERGLARAQLQYLVIGLAILSVGGMTTNLVIPIVTGRSTLSWVGPYFTLPFVALVSHAIIRHRLMDLRIFVSRGLAYALTMAAASAVLIASARLIFPGWAANTALVHPNFVIIAIVALLMLSSPVQRFFGRVLDPYLFRGIEQPVALAGATRRLSRLMQPAELAAELRQLLTEVLVPESFTMLIMSFESQSFEQLSGEASPAVDPRALAALHAGQPNTTVVMVNPTEESGEARLTHIALRAAGVEILVTLGRRGHLLGFVLLGPRRSGDAYFRNDLMFIESIADLASIALENALLYRQRIHMLEYSERLLESLDSAVVAVDVGGRITSFNPAATKLLGLSDEYRGAPMHVLPSEIGWALVLAVSGGWHPREVEVTIDHTVRGILHVILSTAVLHDDEQRISGALVVVTDLSAVKALERNQRRIEHLAIMARFYAGIAHEIRNPLAAISNFIAMLPDRFDDPEYRDTAVRLLPLEVSRIVRLADRLRLMAPSEGGKLVDVSIAPLLHDIVAIHSPTSEEQEVKIKLHCPDNLPKVQGDPGQIVQLFVNLLRNAVEAMPDGGTVTIEADQTPSRIGAGSVVVRVLDEGTGVDPAVRAKIFDPFFTTKPSGTGLGLSICREIADFHRARLTLLPRSLVDGGTIAEVEFPCIASDPLPA
jgi:signal transduction histidine kinase